MAGGIVYLDVDDEITSAATRIRGVEGRRVALVLPYGSRVATSRINFRLLSRDALINEKQLAVVAGDSSTRALAASAGLPVFGSVGEYEASLAGIGEDRPAETTTLTPPAEATPPPKPARRRAKPSSATSEPATDAEARRADAAGGSAGAVGATSEATIPFERPRPRATDGEPGWAEPHPRPSARADHLAATRPGSRRASRLPLVIVLAALALVVLVGGVGAYVVLPSATIVITPRLEAITLPAETVAADPAAAEPNATSRVIPADLVQNKVIVGDTFPASGERVEETAAKGVVRFSNLDFLRTNTVEAGSIVSTNAGVRFRTAATVTVPRADLVGLTVFPGRVNVNVTAVEPGTAANVEPNTVVVVPRGEDPQALKVVNPDAITGGTHEEFPVVAQEDVDAAVATLSARIAADTSTVAAAQAANPDRTVFEETLTVGEPSPNVDPSTFVGQEIDSFELQMTAQATILAVDPGPVAAIAETLIRGLVKPGYDLVAGSIDVTVGSPEVTGQSVSFPVTARAQQVAILDADELRERVMGKPLDTARALLAPFGEVELTAWPDWVSSVPTLADRVDVQIERSVDIETPAPAGSTSSPAGS
jgi:hypothetical protein